MSARTHTVQKLAEMVRSGQRADSADSAVRAPGFQQHATKLRWHSGYMSCLTHSLLQSL